MPNGTSVDGKGSFFANQAPGVYLQDTFGLPRRSMFYTGVPVFLGLMQKPSESVTERVKARASLVELVGSLWASHRNPIARLLAGLCGEGIF